MFARIALALPFGAAATAVLLFLMNLMIETGEVATVPGAMRIVDFARIERTETVKLEEERPEPPAAPEVMPRMAMLDLAPESIGTIELPLLTPKVDLSSSFQSGGFTDYDGEYLPMFKAAPRYPQRALQRRLEGYVIVEFVVTTSGAVRDVVVVESTSEIFEQSAIEAALQFKYKPRVIDGQPIEVSGVQNRITFRLEA